MKQRTTFHYAIGTVEQCLEHGIVEAFDALHALEIVRDGTDIELSDACSIHISETPACACAAAQPARAAATPGGAL